MHKPFAPACERNAEPILQALRQYLPEHAEILEIASGTGQHAVHFCQAQAGWQWQCSDRAENIAGIASWLAELPHGRLPVPLTLDVLQGMWPTEKFDAIFSANSLHIMPWEAVLALFQQLGGLIRSGGHCLIYGPFNYAGEYTSPSNAAFDLWLKQQAPHQKIRDFEAVDALAQSAGLKLLADHAMPANNRLLCWQKD